MGIIVLKEAVNNIRSKQMDEESQKLRYHALEVYDYIERTELGLVNVVSKNNISLGDFSVLTTTKTSEMIDEDDNI